MTARVLPLFALVIAATLHGADTTPKKGPRPPPVQLTKAALRQEERVYRTTPEGNLNLHFFIPQDAKPSDRRAAILFFHGMGGGAEGFFPDAQYFASRGLVSASADYPIIRGPTRNVIRADESIGHAKSAVRWLRAHASEFGVDPSKVIVAGGSWGGMVALQTALVPGFDAPDDDRSISCEPNALVLFNPTVHPRADVANAAGETIAEKISPARFQKANMPPAIFFYGTADNLFEAGTKFVAKSKELGNRCVYFTAENQPHGFSGREPWLTATTVEVDRFLVSLGYLSGESPLVPKADLTAVK